jgi:hypothetical protein
MDTGLGRTTGTTVAVWPSALAVARGAARVTTQAGEVIYRPLARHHWKAVVAAKGPIPLRASSSSAQRMCQAPTHLASHRSSGEEH